MKISDGIKRHRADIIIIGSLLLVGIISLSLLFVFKEKGERVVVEINGRTVAEYPLMEEGKYTLGGGKNTLVIKNGDAYMESADCPDKTCVRSGRIKNVGESITCLPNKTHIYISGSGGTELVS